MYLGFASEDLDQNQITDYLTRVVQPKLSAVSGVQRADILGDRTFAMRVWLKPGRWPPSGSRPRDVRDALARTTTSRRSAGPRARWCRSTSIANTDLKTAEEFRQLVVKEKDGVWSAWARSRTSCSAPRTTTRTSASTARPRPSWASGCCRRPTRSTSSGASARAMPEIQAQLPAGMKVGIPYDSTEYIQDAINEVLQDAVRDAADRRHRDLPLPRLVPRGAHPGGGDPDLAGRAPCS